LHAPLDVQVDAQGYITDWARACLWNFVTGAYHGKPEAVRDHVELGNDFSMHTLEPHV
jgi:hypothetical protein